jgi:UDP-2,4-diacetamido-2,4,6-trideoxy-beta-L-altropyranose hydrolase
MEAVFFTEGGKNLGLGHLTRCISLAQAFAEKEIISKFVVSADSSVRSILKDYQPHYLDWTRGSQNLHEHLNAKNIAVIDSYSADITIYQKIKQLARMSIYFDDFNRLRYPAGIVINGSLSANTIPYPSTEKVYYLLGPMYQPVRKSFWILKTKHHKSSVKTLFLSCGGGDPHQLTPKLVEFVSRHYPGLLIVTIISESFQNPEMKQSSFNDKIRSLFAPSEKRLCQVMQNCDLAITAAGQTLFELAAAGVPPIVIGTAQNQENNINSWLNTDFIEFAGWWNDKKLMSSLKLYLDKLISDRSIRERKSRIGQHVIDGQGSHRIVEKVLKYVRNN